MKKVLIIGSKGFIGSALTRYLRSVNYEVFEADIVQEYGNPSYLQIDPNGSDYEFEQVFKIKTYDACINCSGAALVGASFENPLHDYRLNTLNVYRMLNSISQYNPHCHFITLSSAAVYGNPKTLPVKEDHPLAPISPYGFHKLQAEEICRHFADKSGIDTSILRIFSAYGPGLKKQLFWDLYQKARNSDSVELFGTGNESRDFIFIEDLCQLIEKVIEGANSFQVINAASGIETTIVDVVNSFYKLLGYNGSHYFGSHKQEGYPTRWVANIDKAKSLGFTPKYCLETGLHKYVEWLKESV